MASDTFVDQLDSLEHRLSELTLGAVKGPPPPLEVMEELSTAVEELHVAAAQLEDADRWIVAERTRYEQLFQLAPDGFVTTDINGVVDQANDAAQRLLNADAGYLRGKPLLIFLRSPDRRPLQRALARLEAGERPDPWRAWVLPRSQQEPLPVELNCAAHPEGSTLTVLWSIRDVSERMHSEELERETLERKRRDVYEYASRLRRLEKAKSDFLDLASHELRGPLTVVRGYMSMITEGALGHVAPQISDVLPIISAKLDEMNRLISQMLETARLEDDRLYLSPARVDARETAAAVVEALRVQAAEKRQRIELATAAQEVTVEADLERLTTALTNLVENALKYSPAGSTVHCRLDVDGGDARFAVTDSGEGVDPGAVDRLFSRFGHGVTSETSGLPGAGLGLFLAREIARRHGGDVTAGSAPGSGSTFVLTLPLAAAPG